MSIQNEISFLERFTRSSVVAVLILGFLVLILQIPILMIYGVIQERTGTRNEAIREVVSRWGDHQSITGPRLVVPYQCRIERDEKDKKPIIETRLAHFLPANLKISAQMDSEVRYRGIFEVPIYTMTATIEGSFMQPDFNGWEIALEDILWERAFLSVGISDTSGISGHATLDWKGSPVEFEPGCGIESGGYPGIHAPLGIKANEPDATFRFNLSLKGSQGILFATVGKETVIHLNSDWPAPSFNGAWLPKERTFGKDGFQAEWRSSFLGRNFPQRWSEQANQSREPSFSDSMVGVNLITPVDEYRMTERSVKYAPLFICLTFAVLWLFEVLTGMRIHPVQSLLIGSDLCLFYLLELALAEHLGFGTAYLLATLAILSTVTAYCYSVLKRLRHALTVGLVLSVLYAYLFGVLQNQDYALLVGTLGLFFGLVTVMYLTRHVDWSAAGAPGRMPDSSN